MGAPLAFSALSNFARLCIKRLITGAISHYDKKLYVLHKLHIIKHICIYNSLACVDAPTFYRFDPRDSGMADALIPARNIPAYAEPAE